MENLAPESTSNSDKHLHIIAFDVPFPPNYGGVIDVFYRIKALVALGVNVHLHCFEYGRGESDFLNSLCDVKYYKRDTSLKNHFSFVPYIVKSRISDLLCENLLRDNYPILCEGLHCTSFLFDKRLKNRKIYVRAHNVEHDYYKSLASAEPLFWKKAFFLLESWKLRRYESILERASAIFAISAKDFDYFSAKYSNVFLLPGFCKSDAISSKSGRGEYILYHGNLSVRENYEAAKWLILNVFSKIDFHCIVAGLNPENSLLEIASRYENVSVCASPDDSTLSELLQNAHINILVTNQPTGLKLKLLNALYNGRFCLVNSNMIAGTSLEKLCVVADDSSQIIAEIENLMSKEFTDELISDRAEILRQLYDNETNAQKLVDVVFPENKK